MAVDWLGYGFAALTATGGIVGYIKAGSFMSLIGGLVFGCLAALGSFQMSQNRKTSRFRLSLLSDTFMLILYGVLPFMTPLGTYGTLAVLMGVRFLSSWKMMPAGLLTGASLFMLLRLGLGLLWPRKKNS